MKFSVHFFLIRSELFSLFSKARYCLVGARNKKNLIRLSLLENIVVVFYFFHFQNNLIICISGQYFRVCIEFNTYTNIKILQQVNTIVTSNVIYRFKVIEYVR